MTCFRSLKIPSVLRIASGGSCAAHAAGFIATAQVLLYLMCNQCAVLAREQRLYLGAHCTPRQVYQYELSDMSCPPLPPGDTLFALACGRLIEGNPPTMWNSLSKLVVLPRDTAVYSAHEYTQSNAKFAVTMEGSNELLQERKNAIDEARSKVGGEGGRGKIEGWVVLGRKGGGLVGEGDIGATVLRMRKGRYSELQGGGEEWKADE